MNYHTICGIAFGAMLARISDNSEMNINISLCDNVARFWIVLGRIGGEKGRSKINVKLSRDIMQISESIFGCFGHLLAPILGSSMAVPSCKIRFSAAFTSVGRSRCV